MCVVEIDPGTAAVTVRRFIAVDDCGTRINPMIIEGQIHGGLTDGVGMALMELIAFDEDGNCLGGSLMDYLIPSALEVPDWETGFTVIPSPYHPLGAKGVGECATVGSPSAIVNPADTDRVGVGHGYNTRPSDGTSAAIASAVGKIRAKAQLLAGTALEASPDTLEWSGGAWVKAGRQRSDAGEDDRGDRSVRPRHWRPATGVEGGLDAQTVYRD